MKNPTEHQIQASFTQWLRLQGILGFAIPNGGFRHITVARKVRAEGVLAGVPDYFLPRLGRNGELGLFLEFKTNKGAVSEVQKLVFGELKSRGYTVVVVRSLEEAIKAVHNY
jgi:hypothetical protein